ncbi:MAG TPA: ATP-binding protein, partial [Kofleriaceae bacterium]
TAINVVRGAYLDHIVRLYPSSEALLVIRSVNKLFDIELALMLRHYQLDSEARLVARERAIVTDRIAALQTMSTGLAHEIRNPLNSAKLQLELLERRLLRGSEDAKLLEPTTLARDEIARLTDLLNDFLSFVQTGELRRQTLDVVAIVRHVFELEQPFATTCGCRLALAADPPVISAAVDPSKLHQIVQHLVRNALEAASPNGNVGVRVSKDDALRIRVTDDGRGIPDEVRAKIFEPFFSTKDSGTGMGLAIAHNFVTLHGGTIDIETGDGGTTMHVALP